MLEISKVRELVLLMKENDLTEVSLADEKESVALKRGGVSTIVNHQPVIYNGSGPSVAANPGASYQPAAAPAHAPSHAPAASPAPVSAAPAPAAAPEAAPANAKFIESPMVGTYYASPNPDAPAFVKVGQQVGPDTVVCLIEAMKVFNEIKAETSGTIDRILVKSGEPVEFGQKIIQVRPN
jgi:acetyl-CoA carboxylase biotin carboxyl carrier protein